MSKLTHQIRTPVKRPNSETYLLLTLLSFASSVSLTRLFLAATGYPQLGGGGLHIAHVLWGGLLLFVAALLPLIFANRWSLTACALLAGSGVGLFIDEVGKFITQTNDYFFPAAAPIIYAFFLLTVLLYVQIRRPPPELPRVALYYALEDLEEILDHDLDAAEQAQLVERLQEVSAQQESPELAHLAAALLEFLRSERVRLSPSRSTVFGRLTAQLRKFEAAYLKRPILRAVLSGGMIGLGLYALMGLGQLLFVSLRPGYIEEVIIQQVTAGRLTSTTSLNWLSARLALEGLTGFLLLVSAFLLIIGKDRRGIAFSYLSLLLSLAGVDLIIFYFDQFSSIITALVQFILLLGVLYYRRRFLDAEWLTEEPAPTEPSQGDA